MPSQYSTHTPIERLEQLRAEARYARERYQLYKAKSYGQRPVSSARMRELQRNYEFAEARLHAAEAEDQRASAASDPGPGSSAPPVDEGA